MTPAPPLRAVRKSAKAAAPLDDFDLVAVRILEKEELRLLPLEFDLPDRPGRQSCRFQPLMLRLERIDDHRDVSISIAEIVRLGSALLDGELELEIGLGIAQIDEREAVEVDAVRRRDTKRRLV